MVKLVTGERIASGARILIGCAAVIFDESRERILLTQRADNGRWCLPGGAVDPGESVAEACAREALEETGLVVQVVRLIGVYSSPHMLLEYADGNRWQTISLTFEVSVTGGDLSLSDETTGVGFFTPEEMETMDVMEHHRQRIADALAGHPQTFIR